MTRYPSYSAPNIVILLTLCLTGEALGQDCKDEKLIVSDCDLLHIQKNFESVSEDFRTLAISLGELERENEEAKEGVRATLQGLLKEVENLKRDKDSILENVNEISSIVTSKFASISDTVNILEAHFEEARAAIETGTETEFYPKSVHYSVLAVLALIPILFMTVFVFAALRVRSAHVVRPVTGGNGLDTRREFNTDPKAGMFPSTSSRQPLGNYVRKAPSFSSPRYSNGISPDTREGTPEDAEDDRGSWNIRRRQPSFASDITPNAGGMSSVSLRSGPRSYSSVSTRKETHSSSRITSSFEGPPPILGDKTPLRSQSSVTEQLRSIREPNQNPTSDSESLNPGSVQTPASSYLNELPGASSIGARRSSRVSSRASSVAGNQEPLVISSKPRKRRTPLRGAKGKEDDEMETESKRRKLTPVEDKSKGSVSRRKT